jgi:dihydrodipicolinate synthase/N-acetylneuraminate lyase
MRRSSHLKAVTKAAGLPVMIYNNPVAYGVDVTLDMFEELAEEPLVVAMKESTDDIRRVTDVSSTASATGSMSLPVSTIWRWKAS